MSTLTLSGPADVRLLELAVMNNHRNLFRMNTEALGGVTHIDSGIQYTVDEGGRQSMACLAEDAEKVDLDKARAVLDRMMANLRVAKPGGVGWWSVDPALPEGIGALLFARGFQPGWRPCWMALDLAGNGASGSGANQSTDTPAANDDGPARGDTGNTAADVASNKAGGAEDVAAGHSAGSTAFVSPGLQDSFPRPAGLRIDADNSIETKSVRGLAYGGDQGAVSRALMLRRPDRVQQFVATLNGRIVGHSCIVLSEGALGVAGLYNVGVLAEARLQGVGKALVIEACRWAREKGWRYVVLNGTGRRMYEQVGFRWLGDGHTWWGMNPQLFEKAVPAREVALAEAVGLGDLPALRDLIEAYTEEAPIAVQELIDAENLDRPLANKLTLLQVAIHCKQLAAGQWLVGQGASCSVLEAWDLGWKERAEKLLAEDPSLINFQYGPGKLTLMHIAAERNDLELAAFALSASPNLELKDHFYRNTPLGWAKFLKLGALVKLIESRG